MKKIEVDIDKIAELKITPGQYVIAKLIHSKSFKELKIVRDSYKKDLYFKEDLLNLVNRGYVNKNIPSTTNIIIADCEIIGIFDKEEDSEDPWDVFVRTFRDKFPKGVISGGYYVRSSTLDCDKKLKEFTKSYKFDAETILEATDRYVSRARLQNYKYMKIATYFISKDRMSTLASECDQVLSGDSSGGSVLSGGL